MLRPLHSFSIGIPLPNVSTDDLDQLYKKFNLDKMGSLATLKDKIFMIKTEAGSDVLVIFLPDIHYDFRVARDYVIFVFDVMTGKEKST